MNTIFRTVMTLLILATAVLCTSEVQAKKKNKFGKFFESSEEQSAKPAKKKKKEKASFFNIEPTVQEVSPAVNHPQVEQPPAVQTTPDVRMPSRFEVKQDAESHANKKKKHDLGRSDRHSSENRYEIIGKYLKGEFKEKAESIMKRDDGQRYGNDIGLFYCRAWHKDSWQMALGQGRAIRQVIEAEDVESAVKKLGDMAAFLPEDAVSAKNWVASLRERVAAEERIVAEIEQARKEREVAERKEAERRAKIEKMVSAYPEIMERERSEAIRIMADEYAPLITFARAMLPKDTDLPLRKVVGEINSLIHELPPTESGNGKATAQLDAMRTKMAEAKELAVSLKALVDERERENARIAAEKARAVQTQLAALHPALTNLHIKSAGVALGDSYEKIAGATTLRDPEGSVKLSFPRQKTYVTDDGWTFDFGNFSETGGVFLVQATWQCPANGASAVLTERADALQKEAFRGNATCERQDEIVGYDLEHIRGAAPWGVFQYEYFEKKPASQKRIIDLYKIPPIIVQKVLLSGDGYDVMVKSGPGGATVQEIVFCDKISVRQIKGPTGE